MPTTANSWVFGELDIPWRPFWRILNHVKMYDMLLLSARYDAFDRRGITDPFFDQRDVFGCFLNPSCRRRPDLSRRRRPCRRQVQEAVFFAVQRDRLRDRNSGGSALPRHTPVHLPGEEPG